MTRLDVANLTRGGRDAVELDASAVKKTKPWEYAVRFLFGGLVSAAVGLVSHRWGPAVAGLFAAFPAVLPATVTLVRLHDGRESAAEDSRGASFGAVGLVVFALVVHARAEQWPAWLVLAWAAVTWLAVALALWALALRLHHHPPAPRHPAPRS